MSNAEVFPIVEIPAGGGPGPTAIVYTASFAPTGDQALLLSGQPLIFNSASPLTFTLPSFPPSADWWVLVENIEVGALTVARNGRTIDGAAADLTIQQNQGAIIYTDGANYFTMRGVGGGSGGLNGASVKTGDYPLVAGDNGKLLVMNSGSAHSFTVPSPPPSATWAVFIQNAGAGALTLDRNALTIDTAASNLTLKQGEGLVLFTDGSNYFTERGMSLVKSVAGRTGDVTLAVADVSGASPALARTTAAIDAGTLAAGAQATGTVVMCKSGFLLQVAAVAKSRLRLYKTSAGRASDIARAIGVAAAGGVGLLVELLWLGTAPLTWPMQPDAILENGDGSPVTTIYWTVDNEELASTHQTFTLTYMAIET